MRSLIPMPKPERIERKMLRARRFDRNGNMTDLLAVLRVERFTGTLTVHFGCGGINGVEAQDSQAILDDALDSAIS